MSLLEDRDRIARDLHDLAIQRLFATGMTLQSARPFVEHPEAAERLGRAIDDLDTTIKIIRSTIFGLREHGPAADASGLRTRVVEAVDTAAPAQDMADHVIAVIVEALSNIARHAGAEEAEVSVVAVDGVLTVTATDDGTGLREGARGSGLRNLTERAEQLGGTLSVVGGPAPRGGTVLEWRVPLPAGRGRGGRGGAHHPPG